MNTLAQSSTTDAVSTSATPSRDVLALAGRVLLAALFLLAGINKLGGAEGTIGYIASVGLPFAEGIFWATVALEIAGAVMLIAGFKTRLVASALGLFSIATAVIFHADLGNQAEFTSFLKNLAIAGGMFQIAAFGPGRLSLDKG